MLNSIKNILFNLMTVFVLTGLVVEANSLNIYSSYVGRGWNGTGFFINNQGYLITAEHVVSGRLKVMKAKVGDITVEYPAKSKIFYKGKVVDRDVANDIALVKINVKNTDHLPLTVVPKIPLVTQSKAKLNTDSTNFVYLSGYCFSYEKYYTTQNYIQKVDHNDLYFDGKICHGQSGGPIYNKKGVVGVASRGWFDIGRSKECAEIGAGPHSSAVIRLLEKNKVNYDVNVRYDMSEKQLSGSIALIFGRLN